MELLARSKTTKHAVKIFAAALAVIAFLSLRSPPIGYKYNYSPVSDSTELTTHSQASLNASEAAVVEEECNIFVGEWIPNPEAPYYTNETCWAIHEHQNCMKYGRPDSEYLRWRWKPDRCDLPLFDPIKFLEMVAGKSIAVVGDSVARNQMQSMICLISRVGGYPRDVSPGPDERFKRWLYENYNFTIATFWSPFLVRSETRADGGPMNTGLFDLYLDEPDPAWATKIDEFDFLIISSGHWFSRTAVYHEQGQIAGCRFCMIPNITDIPSIYAYRHAFRTAFAAIDQREGFRGVTFLRTFAPAHFEGGPWNKGGNCLRRRPYRSNETTLEGMNSEFYEVQVEEFAAAKRRAVKELRLMDLTHPMNLRPDGHPSRYGHWPNENVVLYNDCVHWCLPGPIDSWADFMAHMIQVEARRNNWEKTQ